MAGKARRATQARFALPAECATHAILAANLGPYRCGEWELCVPLLASLGPGMLCLADRGFNGFEHWSQASATGAQLLWRCASTRKLPVERMLSDGSYLSTVGPTGVSQAPAQTRAITVRVIDYKCPRPPDAEPHYRLIATLLDERAAPAMELAKHSPTAGPFSPGRPRRRARWFHSLLAVVATLRAVRTLNRRSPRMVKRRNSRYKAFAWGAPRRVPIDWTPAPAGPMLVAPPGRTRKKLAKRAWSPGNSIGRFII